MLFKTDIDRASAGDPHAQAAVVDKLRPRLTKMAAYYARHTGEDTDDLLQEAWIGLLEALTKIDITIGNPEQYLLKHAKWRLLDAVKRWGRKRERMQHYLETELRCEWDASISSVWVEDFARHLKPTQRIVLHRLLIGMTWREAGESLGCSSANVAYHVRQIQRTYERWTVGEANAAVAVVVD